MQQAIETERLTLRAFTQGDAAAVQRLASNWNVARMLAHMPYPYPEGAAGRWIATHDRARAEGSKYPHAVEWQGEVIGAATIVVHDDSAHEIGYWIGEPYWNRGFATEAAEALVDAAFEHLDAPFVTAGHFVENHASGRVLTKLGFRYTGEIYNWCEARQRTLLALTMKRERQLPLRAAAGSGR
jgi:RimJ/RimL family protein N-acetyltransferase